MVKSSEARRYQDEVRLVCEANGLQPTAESVHLEVDVYRPRKAGDLTNRLKILEDALQGAVYVNDSQVRSLSARLHDDKRNPRVEVKWEVLL